jgi:hypothetical protein
VYIVDVLHPGEQPIFLVEHIDEIDDALAEEALQHWEKHLEFAALAAQKQGTSDVRGWTTTTSPAQSGKCRRIGKSPSDPPMVGHHGGC